MHGHGHDLVHALGMQHMHSVSGDLLKSWKGHRVSDLALAATRRGTFLVATPADDNCVRLYQLDGPAEATLRCDVSIMCTTVSADASHLLVCGPASPRLNRVSLKRAERSAYLSVCGLSHLGCADSEAARLSRVVKLVGC